MSVAHRLKTVATGVLTACADSNRDPAEVQLIAVSKRHDTAAIQAALDAGQVHFGESYAQELRDKARAMAAPSWHFIGRLQRNKIKYVAPVAYRVHALEELAQAEALAKRSDRTVHCLMAVNIGREAQKSGVMPEQVLERAKTLHGVDGVAVVGLMCLPPQREDPEDVAPFFAELRDLAARGRADGLPLHELSMGMSHDYPVAIRNGATWIRVGTAIFGPRP